MGRDRRWLRVAAGTIALIAIGVGSAGRAWACVEPESFVLRIEHAQFGDIGQHAVDFSCEEDGALVVDTTAEIEVKILFATAYHREARWREVWRDDQLLEFEGTTIDDGEPFRVTARLEGDRMIIEGRSGRIDAPPEIVPDHPWNEALIDRSLLFDVRDGALLEVKADATDKEPVVAGGREVEAQKFVVSGDVERDLWYAKDGRWLQWRLERAGGTITLTRSGLE
jgi:hypothetical protein